MGGGDGGGEEMCIRTLWNIYLFDLSIFTPPSPPFSGGHSSCEFDDCGPSPASNLVSLFSAQQDVWLDLFTVAYDKMTSTLADGIEKNLRRPAKE